MRVELLRRAERELNLTPEQREQADKIITASQERARKITEPIAPKIREELQQTRDQFRALLTSDQQIHFDEFMKKQQRPRESHRPPKSSEKSPLAAPAAESAP
jgi:valyl-tRNA synthetase